MKLGEQNFLDLCESLKESFDVKRIKKTDAKTKFILARHINRMRWVDGGNINIRHQSDQQYHIRYSIYFHESVIYHAVIFLIVAMVVLGSNASVMIKLVVPFFLFALLIGLCKLAFFIFDFRINNIINGLISSDVNISNQQKKWIDNPDICSACGQVGVQGLEECFDCGIML